MQSINRAQIAQKALKNTNVYGGISMNKKLTRLCIMVFLLCFICNNTFFSSCNYADSYTNILKLDFDGDVLDTSGNGLNGTWVGTPSYVTGHTGLAADFSPSAGNYVTVDNNGINNSLNGKERLRVSLWARKNNAENGGVLIVQHTQFRILIGARYVYAYIGGEDGTLYTVNKDIVSTIYDTEWHHYVLEYDGTTVRMSVDDVITAEKAMTGAVRSDSSHDLFIGKDPWGSSFDGQIDEVELTSINPEEENEELRALPAGEPGKVRLTWPEKADAVEYVIMRATRLGWLGKLSLSQDLVEGDDTVHVNGTTEGLEQGDMIYIYTRHIIEGVIDNNTLSISPEVDRNLSASNYSVNLSGCWAKDYTGYSEVARISGVTEYVDTIPEEEQDYYYIIGYVDGSGEMTCSNPVQVMLSGGTLYYDAALCCYGGYAYKSGNDNYSDMANLIDGDDNTIEVKIQYGNPELDVGYASNIRGFTRLNLDGKTDIKRVDISQDKNTYNTRATKVSLRFDDRSQQTFDLENDPTIIKTDNGSLRTYSIPLNVSSSYVIIFIEEITNPSGLAIKWGGVSVYTDKPILDPVRRANDEKFVKVTVDYTQNDGEFSGILGTDEVYLDTEQESGWQLKAWQHTKDIFNMYRIQMGDYWPHAYNYYVLKIGDLAVDVTETQTQWILCNVDIDVLKRLVNGSTLKTGYELMAMKSFNEATSTLSLVRGKDSTIPVAYPAGTSVYALVAGPRGKMTDCLPEFKTVEYFRALVSGISSIPSSVPYNDPSRYCIIDDVIISVPKDSEGNYYEYFEIGDVFRVGLEVFLVTGRDMDYETANPGFQRLSVRRGYDGTNEPAIQSSYVERNIYKLLDYEPYYEGFKNDPTDPANYNWEAWDYTFDKVIKDGDAIPWLIIWGMRYTGNTRGLVGRIESLGDGTNNVLVDEYNSTHDDQDWWYAIKQGNDLMDDSMIAGNQYQCGDFRLHILTGDAEGKVFFVRSNTSDSLRVVRSYEDTWASNRNPNYVDLIAEGVKPGDAYIIMRYPTKPSNTTRKYWQYFADVYYNGIRYILEKYGDELDGRPVFAEYYLEPDHSEYGVWSNDAYVESYNIFANTLRTGGPHFTEGIPDNQLKVGAGALAGGLDSCLEGGSGEYGTVLSLIRDTQHLDFISYHDYDTGIRTKQRIEGWEYWMLKSYAESLGKDIMIINSEGTAATNVGLQHGDIQSSGLTVAYWGSQFTRCYYGDYGPNGQLDFFIHFRLYKADTRTPFYMTTTLDGVDPVYNMAYWIFQFLRDNTSSDYNNRDTFTLTRREGDQYEWLGTAATTHGVTNEKKVFLVNRKEQPITVELTLNGVSSEEISGAYMQSIIGSGPEKTIDIGPHTIDYMGETGNGVVRTVDVPDVTQIELPAQSFNVITFPDGD